MDHCPVRNRRGRIHLGGLVDVTLAARETAPDVNLLMTARVRATPEECTGAILDEMEGRSRWWRPYLLLRHRPATPHEAPGCVVDVLANAAGHTERLIGTTRWGWRLDVLEPGKRMRWSLIDGDYRGWMEWTLESANHGATLVAVSGWLTPRGWNRVRALAWDEIFEVTRLLRRGFDNMGRYIATLAPPESPFDDDPPVEDPFDYPPDDDPVSGEDEEYDYLVDAEWGRS